MTLINSQDSGGRSTVYQQYLLSVQQAAGAAGAALFIEPANTEQIEPFLVHTGTGVEIPEFSDTSTATTATVQHVAKGAYIGFFPSQTANACLLKVAVGASNWQRQAGDGQVSDSSDERRISAGDNQTEDISGHLWVGLIFESEQPVGALHKAQDTLFAGSAESPDWLAHTLAMGANLVWETHLLQLLLRDPTSQLPARAEFQGRLKSAFKNAASNNNTLGLLLLNPDEFGLINKRLGRESGDNAVAEVANKLRDCLRTSDTIYRYGGAVFAVLMPKANKEAVEAVATKIRELLTGAYLHGAVRLTFSVGAVVYNSSTEDEVALDWLGLLRRADHALNLAKRAGGNCSITWNPDETEVASAGVDRLSGIFTADAEKDYRNMLLMWDTIAVISSGAQKEQIAAEFAERINISLRPSRVALIQFRGEVETRVLAVAQRSDTNGTAPFNLTAEQDGLISRCRKVSATEKISFARPDVDDGPEEIPFYGYGVPIKADERSLGCLYLDGPVHSHTLDSSDVIFLEALAGQLGLALDRADLAARSKEESERESKRLREEVSELRKVVHSAQLVYSSKQMQNVLDMLRAVAPTDVTILIDGESGTGKEMLARAIHEMSDHRDKAMVTVDCGAIAHNLLETELFGYVKGAYTGAQTASKGRIVQAEGGTLFLDEIGELPLDVQAKLLRFVQEKEINPVGGTRTQRVDTRIIAATNRDLADEVAAGRFREDLYYRLKVVTATSPPLRERPDDIMPLAKHFLEKFSLQYHKHAHRFSTETEAFLMDYHWPGNVRELQNSILRAVVLSQGETLQRDLLEVDDYILADDGLSMPTAPVPQLASYYGAPVDSNVEPLGLASVPSNENSATAIAPTSRYLGADPWASVQSGLIEQLNIALADPAAGGAPLGRWLTEDLIIAANESADGNARQAASQLGIAETTFRRQLEKVQKAKSQGILLRPSSWGPMQLLLTQLAGSLKGKPGTSSAVEKAKQLLLKEVVSRVNGNESLGSALMGVTAPTYKRWCDTAFVSQ